MNPGTTNHNLMKSLSLLIGGCLSCAIMVLLVLSDPMLTASLWPGDINAQIIRTFGGQVRVDFAGGTEVELLFVPVLIRIFGLATALLALGLLLRILIRETLCRQTVSQLTRQLGLVWLASLVWTGLWLLADLQPASIFSQLYYLAPGLWLSLFPAATLTAILPETRMRAPSADLPPKRVDWQLVVLLVATGCWICVSFWMNERLYAGLWIPHGDSAMYEEHLWNVWHGKGFRSYLDQGLFLGEHIQVIHLLLLPIHMIWPSHLMLELAESIALGICVVPVYSIALRHSGSRSAAMWLGLAWLLFFPMHFLDIAIDLKTLRPGSFGLPFLFWGIDLAERRQLWKSSACFLVALSAQEDFALITGPIGLVLWLTSGRKGCSPAEDSSPDVSSGSPSEQKTEGRTYQLWSIGLCAFSALYVLMAVWVVIPWFRSGVPVHYSRYFGDLGNSPGDLVRTTLQEPQRVLAQFFCLRTFLYLMVFSVPIGFVLWRSPLRLLAACVTFVMLSLIQLGNADSVPSESGAAETTAAAHIDLPPVPYHHFHAPMLPVLFWAAAAGLRGGRIHLLSGAVNPGNIARFAFFCALFSAVTNSMMPVGLGFWSTQSRTGYARLFVPGPRAEHFNKLAPFLPVTSRIASTDYVHTRLTHCDRSYDYSGYLRAVNNYQPGVPADTDIIVIDTQHPYSVIKSPSQVRELNEQADQWRLREDLSDDYFLVIERIRDSGSNKKTNGEQDSSVANG
ncbi:MAG: DUF2079 domain-containing protein [Planctomycetaceae bacterium]